MPAARMLWHWPSHPGWVRRTLVAAVTALLSLSLAACATTAAHADRVTERSVSIAMPAGTADALLFHPAGVGRWPAVIVWSDIAGPRPAFAEIGRALAGQGYVVLIPNHFYRSARIDGRHSPGQLTPEQMRERTTSWTAAISDDGAKEDTRAYMAFLDALPQVAGEAKAGTIGYNYGAPYAFHAATAMPDRFGAVAVLHPFRIATTRAGSPHLAVDRSKAAYFVAIAQPDDAREPEDKNDLRRAFAAAGLVGTVEVLPARQGFAVSDDPAYDAVAAGLAWTRVSELLRAHLR